MLLYCLNMIVVPPMSENTSLNITCIPLHSNAPDNTSFRPSQVPVSVVNPGALLVTTYPRSARLRIPR
jgi:hypothetical protein